MASHLAGLSLLEAAEAASPGPGRAERRTLHTTPMRQGAAFAGGAISEGEEEDEEDDEVCRTLGILGSGGRG